MKLPIGVIFLLCAALCGIASVPAAASDAPAWMRAQVNASLPQHDEKTEGVLMYSEEVHTVQPNGRIKETDRVVYKILRPDGRHLGQIYIPFDGETRITSLHGWCIPAQGKEFEVKEKDAIERQFIAAEGGEFYNDLRYKIMQIPAPDPGNLVGYEVEHEDRPFVYQVEWMFQTRLPVREARYSLQLPPGWEFKEVWLNHPEVPATSLGNNQWQWTVNDVATIRAEEEMPPFQGLAGQLLIRISPPAGGATGKSFANWNDMGKWYGELWKGRQDVSPDMKRKVAELTQSSPNKLVQMRALAQFVQSNVRYVAIEFGIGGWQPHNANDVFVHKYGDCKDKTALLTAMLHEIGVDAYHVAIHTTRGVVAPNVPPRLGIFNHAMLAIRLPDGVNDSSLLSTMQHSSLGQLLFFDPTDDLMPFGRIRGELQANYGLLVTPDGGQLVELPRLPGTLNGVRRSGRLTLDGRGSLNGEIQEVRMGDFASYERFRIKSVTLDADRIKPIETLMSSSLGNFRITRASLGNLQDLSLPFEFNWAFVSQDYGKAAGNLLLVRPRVVGLKASELLETKEPRKFPVVFEGPRHDTDKFEITLPEGYEVDDLPPPVDADYSFASYHSKTEASGNVLRYTRSFEIKELSVPMSKMDDLKKFYRIIASDERNTAVLRPSAK
jgi:hypothetical protein